MLGFTCGSSCVFRGNRILGCLTPGGRAPCATFGLAFRFRLLRLGGSPYSRVKALDVDAQGRVLFTGVTVTASQAALANNPAFRSTYVARLASDGATLTDFYQGPTDLVGWDLANGWAFLLKDVDVE